MNRGQPLLHMSLSGPSLSGVLFTSLIFTALFLTALDALLKASFLFFFSGTGMLTVSTVFSKGCFWVWSKSGWRGTSEGFEASLRGLGNGPRKATHVLGFQIYLSPDCVKPLCFLATWVPTQSLYSIVSALYADEGPIFQYPMGTYRALCLLRAQRRHYVLVLWL